MHDQTLMSEIARNFDQFQRSLALYLDQHQGRYALLQDGLVIDFFDKPGEADRAGKQRFGDAPYSIQQVTAEPLQLGTYFDAAD